MSASAALGALLFQVRDLPPPAPGHELALGRAALRQAEGAARRLVEDLESEQLIEQLEASLAACERGELPFHRLPGRRP